MLVEQNAGACIGAAFSHPAQGDFGQAHIAASQDFGIQIVGLASQRQGIFGQAQGARKIVLLEVGIGQIAHAQRAVRVGVGQVREVQRLGVGLQADAAVRFAGVNDAAHGVDGVHQHRVGVKLGLAQRLVMGLDGALVLLGALVVPSQAVQCRRTPPALARFFGQPQDLQLVDDGFVSPARIRQ